MMEVECIIAGKTKSEILSMPRWKRSRWYKTLTTKDEVCARGLLKDRVRQIMSVTGENNRNFGRKHTEEIKKVWSYLKEGSKNPMYGKTFTHSEKARIKMRVAKLGKTFTKEHKRKISEATSGKNNPNWRDGKSYELYGLDFDNILRRQIRERDNYICQKCLRIEEEFDRVLTVHHIDYNKRNNIPENLISLCNVCHGKTGYNRAFWIDYFGEILKYSGGD